MHVVLSTSYEADFFFCKIDLTIGQKIDSRVKKSREADTVVCLLFKKYISAKFFFLIIYKLKTTKN